MRTWQKESKSLRLVEAAVIPRVDGRIYQRYEELPIREIWLVDVEEGKEKLEIVSQMSQRMWMLLRMKSKSMQLWIGKKH